MRELVITNIQIIADARGDDAADQAFKVINALNDYADKVDGSPTIFIMSDPITATFRQNGESDD